MMILSLSACGEKKEENESNNQSKDQTVISDNKDTEVQKEKITVDDVKKAKETPASLFEYVEVDGGVSITAFNGADEIVSIPTMIDGKTVVAIGNNAFINNDSMKGIKIADTVKVIGEGAFMNCTELLIVVFGNEVESIEQYAFSGSKKLYLVELNNGLKNMGWGSFGLTNLTEIEIPSSVIVIDYPFNVNNEEHYITIVGEAGSMAEQFVNESEDEDHLKFRAK